MTKHYFLICLLSAPLALFSQQIHYVKADASGANTGLSWQDAFTDLQSALTVAGYGDDIWVAAGTYKPTAADDRTATFDLPPGVRLAGGFAGTETQFGEREWEHNETILSGDIGAPDLWEDNSYHVVRIYGGDTLTVLDGFKVMHGRGGTFNDPTPQAYGGGVLVWADAGRPVSVPLIQNCTFERNYSTSGGGLACVSQYDEYTPAPTVRNCRFLFNRGEYQGGSFCKKGKCWGERAFLVENCEFRKNYCLQYGGAMAVAISTGTIMLKGCSFQSDSTQFEGGAIFFESSQVITYIIDSCSFLNNTTVVGNGGAISHLQNSNVSNLIIQRSHFASNRSKFNNGGALSSGAFGEEHQVTIHDTNFDSNLALNGGSGIYVEGSVYSIVQINIDRCRFVKNLYSNTSTGGGAFLYRSNGTLFVQNHNRITNSVFAYNDGAISAFGDNPGISTTDVVNCTFLNNGFVPFIKYWSPDFNTSDYYQKMQILNSVIWEEETPGVHRLFYNNNPTDFSVNNYKVEHSLVNFPTCEYDGVDPCGAGMLYEEAPQFVSADPDMPDVSVALGSPAINRGSNTVVDTFGLQYDIAGHPRIRQDTVDIGAFELDSVTSVSDPFLKGLSFMMQAQPTVLSVGQAIQIQVLNTDKMKDFNISFIGTDGMVRYKATFRDVLPLVPVSCFVPTTRFQPGIYLLLIDDGQGQRKTQKIVVTD